jgi:hypothetical protein
MPDVIRHPVSFWIPAYAGMTILGYLTAGVITSVGGKHFLAWAVPDPKLTICKIAGLNRGNILQKGFGYIGGPRK